MPVWRALLASCLSALALLPADAVRADTAVAALVRAQPVTEPVEPELDCLALNIYWEARSESLLGQTAVAAVTLNRVAAPAFPDSVCEVVFQGEERGRHLCQFSWRCDGRSDDPRNPVAWAEARRIARLVLSDQVTDPTGGALWYHAAHVLPAWTRTMTLRTRIGHHLFYARRPPGEAQEPREGGIAGSSAQPGPMTMLAAAGQDFFELSSGDLRIDVEHDPAGGLLLCEDPTLCGAALAHVQATRGTNAADRRMSEPRVSAENAPPVPAAPKRSSIPLS